MPAKVSSHHCLLYLNSPRGDTIKWEGGNFYEFEFEIKFIPLTKNKQFPLFFILPTYMRLQIALQIFLYL